MQLRGINKPAMMVMSIFLAGACFSCRPALGSAWYSRSVNQEKMNDALPPLDNENEGNIPEPQNPDSYTEVNPFEYFKEDYLYPAAQFDDWVLYMTDITASNIASYKFEVVTPWKNKGNGEYEYARTDGKGSVIGEGQQNKTWSLTYYMYKKRKDRWRSNGFDPHLTSEEAEKQKRFYFYRFTGEATANTHLNNSIFCVDTYSKLLFFYSEPAVKTVVFGNTIPSDWQDYGAETNGAHIKRDKQFYEYDPVGYVKEDGSVVIYNWFTAKIIASDYSPSMNEKYKYVAKAGKPGEKGRPGHSPYKYEKLKIYGSEEDDSSTNPILWIHAKSLKNSTMAGLNWSVINVSSPIDPRFSYSLKSTLLYTENGNAVNKSAELVQKNNGSDSISVDDFQAIKTGTELSFYSKLFQQEIPADSKDQTVSLDLQIIKANTGGYATPPYTRLFQTFYLYKFSNPITITYDKDSKTWKCPAVTDKKIIADDPNQPSIKISYPAFELKRRQIKDFVITLNSAKKKDHKEHDMAAEGEIEVTYTIGFN